MSSHALTICRTLLVSWSYLSNSLHNITIRATQRNITERIQGFSVEEMTDVPLQVNKQENLASSSQHKHGSSVISTLLALVLRFSEGVHSFICVAI